MTTSKSGRPKAASKKVATKRTVARRPSPAPDKKRPSRSVRPAAASPRPKTVQRASIQRTATATATVRRPVKRPLSPAAKEAQTLARRIAQIAAEKKGLDIRILNLVGLSGVTDFFVIVSGDADMHVRAIADTIESDLKKDGVHLAGKEGVREGRWALLDYVDVVAHIFIDPVRRFYALEKLWGDAPSETVE